MALLPCAPMRIADFDYSLPAELIAQYPTPERRASRLLEVGSTLTDRQFADLPALLRAARHHRFVLFCDDLSFSHDDQHYKSLKAVLDGGIEGRPDNVVFYATSNRRHLMPRDMIENERSTAISPSEATEEKVSLSDRFGRKPLVILGAASLAFGAIPLFHLLHHSDPAMILMGELGFVLGLGLLAGGLAAANVEMMPAPIRCTGLAFAYNASIGWFGGTTPLIAAWLIVETADPIAPGYWVAAAGGVSLLAALVLMRETRFSEL